MKRVIVVVSICISLVVAATVFLRGHSACVTGLALPGREVKLGVIGDEPLLRGVSFNAVGQRSLTLLVDAQRGALRQDDASRFAEYFLNALTVPLSDQWVNLAPGEEDRVISSLLADTALGRDLLRQDYQLKQVAASLTHPSRASGKAYWKAGSGSIGKIWIEPGRVVTAEDGGVVAIAQADLVVRSESSADAAIVSELTNAVNHDAVFAPLRQMYGAMILAQRCKELRSSVALALDADRASTLSQQHYRGATEAVVDYYQKAYVRGAYHVLARTDGVVRRYFCGGFSPDRLTGIVVRRGPEAVSSALQGDEREVLIHFAEQTRRRSAFSKGDKKVAAADKDLLDGAQQALLYGIARDRVLAQEETYRRFGRPVGFELEVYGGFRRNNLLLERAFDVQAEFGTDGENVIEEISPGVSWSFHTQADMAEKLLYTDVFSDGGFESLQINVGTPASVFDKISAGSTQSFLYSARKLMAVAVAVYARDERIWHKKSPKVVEMWRGKEKVSVVKGIEYYRFEYAFADADSYPSNKMRAIAEYVWLSHLVLEQRYGMAKHFDTTAFSRLLWEQDAISKFIDDVYEKSESDRLHELSFNVNDGHQFSAMVEYRVKYPMAIERLTVAVDRFVADVRAALSLAVIAGGVAPTSSAVGGVDMRRLAGDQVRESNRQNRSSEKTRSFVVESVDVVPTKGKKRKAL